MHSFSSFSSFMICIKTTAFPQKTKKKLASGFRPLPSILFSKKEPSNLIQSRWTDSPEEFWLPEQADKQQKNRKINRNWLLRLHSWLPALRRLRRAFNRKGGSRDPLMTNTALFECSKVDVIPNPQLLYGAVQ